MRLLACHTCWSWVAPEGGTCPECLFPIDPFAADPARSVLQQTFGELVTRISVVRLDRTRLPGWGSLVGTTQGLMFLPYFTTYDDGALIPLQAGSRWSCWQFWRSSHPSVFPTMGQESVGDCDLVGVFFDTPGALFIPRSHIERMHLRLRQWSITRATGHVVRITPLSVPEEWQPAWRRLFADHVDWQRPQKL